MGYYNSKPIFMNRRISKIIKKIINKKISEQEENIIEDWFNSIHIEVKEDWSDSELKNLKERIHNKIHKRAFPYWTVAAAAILLIAFGILGVKLLSIKPEIQQIATTPLEIKPGEFNGVLKQDGQKDISLIDLQVDSIYSFNGICLQRIDSNEVKIIPLPNSLIQRQMIQAPRGSNIIVQLVDGTRVTLNANASLVFPTQFSSTERRVSLTGEGYFEVTKDKNHPFRVEIGPSTIQVLGTKFNVNYRPNQTMSTKLFEGKIQVSHPNFKIVLTPGKEIMVHPDGQYRLNTFNLAKGNPWKDGRIDLDGKNIKEIMTEVADWYNVDVDLENADTSLKYMGEISKFSDIHDLLETLSLAKGNQFEIKGRRIIVK